MGKLWRNIKAYWSWKTIFESRSDYYQENSVSKERRIIQKIRPKGFGYSPPDSMWVDGYPRGTTFSLPGRIIPPADED